MPRVNYYNVYEKDTLVLECVTAKEIALKLGYTKQHVQKCIMSDKQLGGIYNITYVADNSTPEIADKTFCEEWEAAVMPFKGVRWSKHKGKKLVIHK